MSSRSVRNVFCGLAAGLGLAAAGAAGGEMPRLGFEADAAAQEKFTPIPLRQSTEIARPESKSLVIPPAWPHAKVTVTKSASSAKDAAKPASATTTSVDACRPAAAADVVVPAPDAVVVVPPPGTLGYTYRRYSAPIPCDRHPRTGMLEVRGAPADAVLTVEGMQGFPAECGVWRFETVCPLFPGTPHIYRVVARRWCEGHPVVEVRTLRLIPGRIVTLDF